MEAKRILRIMTTISALVSGTRVTRTAHERAAKSCERDYRQLGISQFPQFAGRTSRVLAQIDDPTNGTNWFLQNHLRRRMTAYKETPEIINAPMPTILN